MTERIITAWSWTIGSDDKTDRIVLRGAAVRRFMKFVKRKDRVDVPQLVGYKVETGRPVYVRFLGRAWVIERRPHMASDARATILKLLDKWEEVEQARAEQVAAIFAELRSVVDGGDGIGVKLTRLKTFWCETWTERYGERCEFDHRKDTGHLKRWLVANWSPEQIEAKMLAYLTDNDAFYVSRRHPFGFFVKGFNTWRGITEAVPVDSGQAAKMRGRA